MEDEEFIEILKKNMWLRCIFRARVIVKAVPHTLLEYLPQEQGLN